MHTNAPTNAVSLETSPFHLPAAIALLAYVSPHVSSPPRPIPSPPPCRPGHDRVYGTLLAACDDPPPPRSRGSGIIEWVPPAPRSPLRAPLATTTRTTNQVLIRIVERRPATVPLLLVADAFFFRREGRGGEGKNKKTDRYRGERRESINRCRHGGRATNLSRNWNCSARGSARRFDDGRRCWILQ